jgi:hypothetical protein
MNSSQPGPRIIYIAGYGRSGSTLLDVLFGNHPQMTGAGELSAIFQEWASGQACSCGKPYPGCEFWSGVIARLQATWPEMTPEQAERITRQIEAPRQPQQSSSPYGNPGEAYCRLWRNLLEAICQESGKNIVVDSSKNTMPSLRRIQALANTCELNVQVIHLVRDPRATMWSALRGVYTQVDLGHQARARRGGALRALIGWGIANIAVDLIARQNRQLKFIRIRYEDLVRKPVQELQKLDTFLNLDLSPVIEAITDQTPLEPGHGVKGNRMRRRGPVQLKLDEEWRTALPKSARMLARLSWPLASRYGYHVLQPAD